MNDPRYKDITPKTTKTPAKRPAKKEKKYRKTRHYHRIYKDDINNAIIAKVGTTAWAVYSVIKSHKHWDTHTCFPSFQRIMELTGITKHGTVRKAIETLKDNGLLTYEMNKRCKPNGTEYGRLRHVYTLPKDKTFY